MVQDLRRTFVHRSSLDEARGRLCGDAAHTRIQARAARVLRREGSEYQGRIAEAKGFPKRNGCPRSIAAGVGGWRTGAPTAPPPIKALIDEALEGARSFRFQLLHTQGSVVVDIGFVEESFYESQIFILGQGAVIIRIGLLEHLGTDDTFHFLAVESLIGILVEFVEMRACSGL